MNATFQLASKGLDHTIVVCNLTQMLEVARNIAFILENSLQSQFNLFYQI